MSGWAHWHGRPGGETGTRGTLSGWPSSRASCGWLVGRRGPSRRWNATTQCKRPSRSSPPSSQHGRGRTRRGRASRPTSLACFAGGCTRSSARTNVTCPRRRRISARARNGWSSRPHAPTRPSPGTSMAWISPPSWRASPTTSAQIFLLRIREGLETREIAARLSLTPRTVSRHWNVTLRRLRALLRRGSQGL